MWLIGYPSAHSRNAFRVDLGEWVAFCRASHIDPVTARRFHVEAWARGLEADPRRLAPATIARKISAVSSWYSWAEQQDYVTRNPCRGVRKPPPQVDPARRAGLTRDELAELLRAADTSGRPFAPRDALMIRLMALNGLRVSSVAAANIGDLGSFQGQPGLTFTVKGNSRQFTPFAQSTITARDGWLAVLQSQPHIGTAVTVRAGQPRKVKLPLFTGEATAARMTRESIAYVLRRVARRSDLPAEISEAITPHWLRHTFVTLALAAGVPLHHVQDGAGHASPETTRLYDGNRHSVASHATFALDALVSG